MSRGGSHGGGQSTLGYLFGSEEQPSAQQQPPPVEPPYGIDTSGISSEKPPVHRRSRVKVDPSGKEKNPNDYHRAEGQNLGNFVTDRPSTKVKSVPGGDSSLGYLFGEK